MVTEALFGLACAVAGGTLTATWLLTFRAKAKTQTIVIPVAKKVEGRVMPDLSRAERRAHKRRRR